MEITYMPQQDDQLQAKHRRLTEIPVDAFHSIVALVNQYQAHDLHTWIADVAERQTILHGSSDVSPSTPVSPQNFSTAATHAMSHRLEDRIRCACPCCWKNFARPSDMARHFMRCKDVVTWQCPDCIRKFSRKDHFRLHHHKHHSCHINPCPHDKQAIRLNPKVTALACGFCEQGHLVPIARLEDLVDYLEHVVDHFERQATRTEWSVTRQIGSLLSQSHIIQLWYALGHARFGSSVEYVPFWSLMTWTSDNSDVKKAIHALEHCTPSESLKQCLIGLLEAGTFPQAQVLMRQSGTVSARSPTAPSLPLGIIGPAIDSSFSTPMRTGFRMDPVSVSPILLTEERRPSKTLDAHEVNELYDPDATTLVNSSGNSEHIDNSETPLGTLVGVRAPQDRWLDASGQSSDSVHEATASTSKTPDIHYRPDFDIALKSSSGSQQPHVRHNYGQNKVSGHDHLSVSRKEGPSYLDVTNESSRVSNGLFDHQGEGPSLDKLPTNIAFESVYPEDFVTDSYNVAHVPIDNVDQPFNHSGRPILQQWSDLGMRMEIDLPNAGVLPALPTVINPRPAIDCSAGHARTRSGRRIQDFWNRIHPHAHHRV